MYLEQPHTLSKEDAIARVKALFAYWYARAGIKEEWQSEDRAKVAGKAKGIKFAAEIVVEDGKICIDAPKVGFLAEKLGAKKYILGKFADYLDPSHSLEALEARAK